MECKGCGGIVSASSRSGKCRSCYKEGTLAQTVGDVWERYDGNRHQYRLVGNYIRRNAQHMYASVEKVCEHCGWQHDVAIHHKVAIADMSRLATVGDVNSRENILFLCGNCHGYMHSYGELPVLLQKPILAH